MISDESLSPPSHSSSQVQRYRDSSGSKQLCFPLEHFEQLRQRLGRKMCVEPAWVGQYPHDGAADRLFLATQLRFGSGKTVSVGTDAQECDHPWSVLFHLPLECRRSFYTLVSRQLSGGVGRATDEVGNSIPVLQQLTFLSGQQQPLGKPTCEKRRPEPIAWPSKMMARCTGIQTRIDAAEQHLQVWRNEVRNRLVDRGLQLFSGRLAKGLQ